MEDKLDAFFSVVRQLNIKFKITPVLYGSLGLSKYIGELTKIDDVDILVPHVYINKKWNALKKFMEEIGYKLTDQKEHEFQKGQIKVAFATEDDLSDIPDFNYSELIDTKEKGVKFRQLTPKLYLDLYVWLQTCDYRVDKGKTKTDKIRIKALKKYMTASNPT